MNGRPVDEPCNDRQKMGTVEIERKWLMDGYPCLPCTRELLQTQGYLSFAPSTVRIRKIQSVSQGIQCEKSNESKESLPGEEYRLTIKGEGGLVRTEVELPLTAAQYEALLPLVVARTAQKRLRTYTLPGGHTLECSLVDESQPHAFYYAEVEFASEAAAVRFEPPAWFGREVTGEAGFSMAAHCRRKAAAE